MLVKSFFIHIEMITDGFSEAVVTMKGDLDRFVVREESIIV